MVGSSGPRVGCRFRDYPGKLAKMTGRICLPMKIAYKLSNGCIAGGHRHIDVPSTGCYECSPLRRRWYRGDAATLELGQCIGGVGVDARCMVEYGPTALLAVSVAITIWRAAAPAAVIAYWSRAQQPDHAVDRHEACIDRAKHSWGVGSTEGSRSEGGPRSVQALRLPPPDQPTSARFA
jgi:hypothetical protein